MVKIMAGLKRRGSAIDVKQTPGGKAAMLKVHYSFVEQFNLFFRLIISFV